jgi:hypothetical protein
MRGRGCGSEAKFPPNPSLIPRIGSSLLLDAPIPALGEMYPFLWRPFPPARPDADDAGVSLAVPLVVLSLSGESAHGEEVSAS